MTEPSNTAPGVPISVTLSTTDTAAVEPFYRELLGWSLPATDTGAIEDAGGVPVAHLGLPGPAGAGWFPVLAASSDAAERVATAGGRVLGENAVGLAVADPAGAHLIVAEQSVVPLPPPGPARAVWFENMTTDPAAADRFYHGAFGLGLAATGTAEYALFLGPTGPVAGRLALPPELAELIGVRWMVYVAHFELDAAIDLVPQLGGTILIPPRDTPTGRVTAVADPTGAILTLLTPAER